MSALIGMVCLGCGCTETMPCVVDGEPCAWVSLDADSGEGLCTACNELPFAELLERVELRQQASQLAQAGRRREGKLDGEIDQCIADAGQILARRYTNALIPSNAGTHRRRP